MRTLLIIFAMFMMACNPDTKKDQQSKLTPDEAKTLAKKAYVYGFLW